VIKEFRQAIRSAGLEPPDVIEADGKLRRFSSNGERGDDAGWYVLHSDGIPAGSFGDWRLGISQSWRADIGRKLNSAEESAYRAKVDAMRRERDTEEARRHAESAAKATAIWKAALPATDDYPYLARKRIKAHGIRFHNGSLVIPLRVGNNLHSLQFIDVDGQKRFLTGGRVAGCYFSIGNPKGAVALCIAEGYATGATIFEATNYPVAVAFNAGNLEPVARALRVKFPEATLIVCADDDTATKGNPGLTKATAAALAVNGTLAVTDFGANRPGGVSDFNDMAALRGAEAVARAIAEARPPAEKSKNESTGGTGKTRSPITVRISDVQREEVTWLWHHRIPRGKLTIIEGDPGEGKSFLSQAIAAAITVGVGLPGEVQREPETVVLMSAEDGLGDTIRPRLEDMGANLSRVIALRGLIDDKGKERPLTLADLDVIEKAITEHRPALVIVDPIIAYVAGKDTHKANEVRSLLAPLGTLAEKYKIAIVAIRHLNKGTGKTAYRGQGSVDFLAACRSAFLAGEDPENSDQKVLCHIKANLGPKTSSLTYTINEGQFFWGEETSLTAEQVLAVPVEAGERNKLDDAKAFLKDALSNGAVKSVELENDAKGAGIAQATLRRAKAAMGIKARKAAFGGGWIWDLPDRRCSSNVQDAHGNKMSAFGKNEHLRQEDADTKAAEAVWTSEL